VHTLTEQVACVGLVPAVQPLLRNDSTDGIAGCATAGNFPAGDWARGGTPFLVSPPRGVGQVKFGNRYIGAVCHAVETRL
jgi:hypothetical protein